MTVLLADIGGTHSRFALLGAKGRPEQTVSWDNDGYRSLEDAIAAYIETLATKPEAAVMAVAGPITGLDIALTNRDWRFNLDRLAERFGLSTYDAAYLELAQRHRLPLATLDRDLRLAAAELRLPLLGT